MRKISIVILALCAFLAFAVTAGAAWGGSVDVTYSVDGVETKVPYSAGNITLATSEEIPALAEFEGFIGWTDGEELYQAGATYSLSEATKLSAVKLGFYTEDGASIRMTDPTGIRFTSVVNRADYDALEALIGEERISLGTLIVPTDYIGDEAPTLETPKVLVIPNIDDEGAITWKTINETEYTYGGSIVNILNNNYFRPFSGVGYFTITYADSTTTTVYGGYDKQEHSRSVYEVSVGAYDDDTKNYSDTQLSVLKSFIDGVVIINGVYETDENGNVTRNEFTIISPDSTKYEITYTVSYNPTLVTIKAITGKTWDPTTVKSIIFNGKAIKNWTIFGMKKDKIGFNYSTDNSWTDPY